jgi:hypothetical protein
MTAMTFHWSVPRHRQTQPVPLLRTVVLDGSGHLVDIAGSLCCKADGPQLPGARSAPQRSSDAMRDRRGARGSQ